MNAKRCLVLFATLVLFAVAPVRTADAQCGDLCVTCTNGSSGCIDTSGAPHTPPDSNWGLDPWSQSNPSPRPAFEDSPGADWGRHGALLAGRFLVIGLTGNIAVPGSGQAVQRVIDFARTRDPSATVGTLASGGGTEAGQTSRTRSPDSPQVERRSPTDQGPPKNLSEEGEIEDKPELDPVDAITGELVIEEVDLALPSAGRPFHLTRVYRSRVSFTGGPLGPAWDLGFNQRIFNLPAVSFGDAVPPAEPVYGRLGVALVDPGAAALFPAESCGPTLVLTTGRLASVAFHEISRSGGSIQYRSEASQLELRGTEAPNGDVTWSLKSPRGDVRHFDADGRLARWVDTNEQGLTFAWSEDPASRLETVVDTEGRVVELEYNASGRLTRVFEAASGLEAVYTYDGGGGVCSSDGTGPLCSARRADGRTERYEYDVDLSRVRGDWVPEDQLRSACANACAVSDATCSTGGACDAVVHEATAACLASCVPCNDACRDEADHECYEACRYNQCASYCDSPEQQAEQLAACEGAYDRLEPKWSPNEIILEPTYCGACVEQCDAMFSEESCLLINAGDVYPFFDVDTCMEHGASCCATGDADSCAPTSCNTGELCWESCDTAFMGARTAPYPQASACDALGPDEPPPIFAPGCLSQARTQCIEQCNDVVMNGSDELDPPVAGCMPSCLGAAYQQCEDICRPSDCPAACVELDLEGQCEDACTTACIADGRAAGPTPGPEYGHPADLNYNILRVYDGAGRLYLTNTYGHDPSSPDFDSITHQDFGGTGQDVGHMWRRDLAYEAELATPPVNSPYWFGPNPASDVVTSRDDFETVQICPFSCPADASPDDVYVPVGNLILAFLDSPAPARLGGYLVDRTLSQAVLPTLVTFSGTPGGTVTGRIERRTSATNYFATTSTRLTITLDGPVDVELRTSTNGDVTVNGPQSGRDQLLAMGAMTLFTDVTRRVRAYAGAPDEVLIVSSGSCTAPFSVSAVSAQEVTLSPENACSGELWITPLAGMYPVAEHARHYATEGLAALSTSAFQSTVLSPERAGFVWRRGIERRLVREVAPSAAGRTYAGRESLTYFTRAPMLSAPAAEGANDAEPLYLFHHVRPDYGTTQPLPAPSDGDWGALDPPGSFVPACNPTYPDPPRRGTLAAATAAGDTPPGPVPARATVLRTLLGGLRVYYSDDRGNVLRVVDHATLTSPEAVVSFNYDPIGQVIAVEKSDGARTCMAYDGGGNVIRQVHMPAPTPSIPAPAPIIQDAQYRVGDSKPVWIGDPRFPGSPLRQFQYDANGNPAAIVDSFGVDQATTTFALVGDPGDDDPARFQIARVTDPSGAQTELDWNRATGTADAVTVDVAGAHLATVMAHDEAGRVTNSITPLGFMTVPTYEGPFLTSSTWSGGTHSGSEGLTYDLDGQVATITVGALRTELTYNLRGDLMQIRRVATDGSAATAVECREVLPDQVVRETVSAEGIRVRSERDVHGRVTRVLAGDLGPSAGSWDDACLDHPPNGASQQHTLATFAYDASGRLLQSTDARGLVTSYVYDGHGRPIIIRPPNGTEVWRGFDALGALVWEATYSLGLVPGTYRPPSWSDAGLRAALEIDYDLRQRVKEIRRWHFETGPIGDGIATTRFAYNDSLRTVTRTDDAGQAWVTRYDGAGRVIEERAPDGTARTMAYSSSPATVRVTEPAPAGPITREVELTAWGAVASQGIVAGSTTHTLSSVTYDDFLRPIRTATLTGGGATTSYDAFGRVVGQGQDVPDGPREGVTLAYDRDGRLRTRTSVADDLVNSTWTWQYDALGREVAAIDPGGGTTTTSYIAGSTFPLTIVDPRGVQTTHIWTGATYLAVAAVDPAGPDVTLGYTWNHAGQLVSAVRTDEGQTGITNTFAHDSLGGKTRETDSILGTPWTRTAVFDGRGLLTRTNVGSSYWTRTYDALSRLSELKVGTETTPLARYTYGGFGFPLTRKLGNNVETRYGYDSLGRLAAQAEVKLGTPDVTLATWTWAIPLDGAPRRAELRRPLATVDAIDVGLYTIDAAGRLASEDNTTAATFSLAPTTPTSQANATAGSAFSTEVWDYVLDGHSSWVEQSRGSQGVVTFTRDTRDALTRINNTNVTLDARGAILNDGTLATTYDALGFVKQVVGTAGTRTYRRDALGRVVSETNASGQVTEYAYDGTTRVLRKHSHGAVDLNIDGAGLDEHVATITGATRRYLHQDRLNSVFLVTDTGGAPAEWTSYTAYGEATLRNPNGTQLQTSAIAAQFGFNGLPHDFALGLVDMRARMYRPTLGRFLSPDPLGLVDGSNRFAFVGASPLLHFDPFGLTGRSRNPFTPSLGIENYSKDPFGEIARHRSRLTTFLDDLATGLDPRGLSTVAPPLGGIDSLKPGTAMFGPPTDPLGAAEGQLLAGLVGTEAAVLVVRGLRAATAATVFGRVGSRATVADEVAAGVRSAADDGLRASVPGASDDGVRVASASDEIATAGSGVNSTPQVGPSTPTVAASAPAAVQRSNAQLIQDIATRVEKRIGGFGPVAGSKKHALANKILTRYQRMFGNRGLEGEVSFIGGVRVPYGTAGSVRIDVLDGSLNIAYDYKFVLNPPGLSLSQVGRIQTHGPSGVLVLEVNP